MVLGEFLFDEFNFLGFISGDVIFNESYMDCGILGLVFVNLRGTGSAGVVISFSGADAVLGGVYFWGAESAGVYISFSGADAACGGVYF